MIKLYNFKYILALPLFLLCFCLQAQTLTHNNNISVNTTSLEWTLTGSSLSPVVTDFELFENDAEIGMKFLTDVIAKIID